MPSGEREKEEGGKKDEAVIVTTSGYSSHPLCLLCLRKRPLSCRLSEDEEGNADRMVMHWTSLDRVSCVLRLFLWLRRESRSSINQKVGGSVKVVWAK